jgi:2-haloacid dehalogenase
MAYQWLLFDADGTLFDFDAAERAAFEQAFGMTGVAFQDHHYAAYRGINQALWHAVEKGELTPAVVKLRRFEELFAMLGVEHSAEEFSGHYQERLADCSELIADAAEVLQALGAKYRMAILTNGLQAVQRRRLERSVIRGHIAEIIISEEIGFSKPAKEFFEVAMARIGNPARADVLMIGDSWGPDILGAVKYGIDACWYNPQGKPRPDEAKITREIESLRELVEWLG